MLLRMRSRKLTRIHLQAASGLFNATINIEIRMPRRSQHTTGQYIRVDDIDEDGLVFGQFVFGRCEAEQRLGRIQAGDAWQLPRFHEIRNHPGRLCPQTESNDVQIFQRKHRFAHHKVQQLARTFGHQRQIVHGLDVAWLRHQRPIVNGDDTVIAIFQYFRSNFGVWREILVPSVSMEQHIDPFAFAENRRRHRLLVCHIQSRWIVRGFAGVQMECYIRIRAFVVGDVAFQEILERHVRPGWRQNQQNWKRNPKTKRTTQCFKINKSVPDKSNGWVSANHSPATWTTEKMFNSIFVWRKERTIYCTQFWQTMIYGSKLTSYSDSRFWAETTIRQGIVPSNGNALNAPLEYMFASLSIKIMTKTTT